jgi:hypothetical protein
MDGPSFTAISLTTDITGLGKNSGDKTVVHISF